ncbi:hypothetical protein ACVRZG_08350 [Streptococcus hyovaginalis]|uniref:hypothetical protein n=1 Tax=Streptococcus hyovaginalis TaxID=149015 RepID=UPI0012EBCB2E|nr:hypothetical protein [Streptococcus hyovaginalis]
MREKLHYQEEQVIMGEDPTRSSHLLSSVNRRTTSRSLVTLVSCAILAGALITGNVQAADQDSEGLSSGEPVISVPVVPVLEANSIPVEQTDLSSSEPEVVSGEVKDVTEQPGTMEVSPLPTTSENNLQNQDEVSTIAETSPAVTEDEVADFDLWEALGMTAEVAKRTGRVALANFPISTAVTEIPIVVSTGIDHLSVVIPREESSVSTSTAEKTTQIVVYFDRTNDSWRGEQLNYLPDFGTTRFSVRAVDNGNDTVTLYVPITKEQISVKDKVSYTVVATTASGLTFSVIDEIVNTPPVIIVDPVVVVDSEGVIDLLAPITVHDFEDGLFENDSLISQIERISYENLDSGILVTLEKGESQILTEAGDYRVTVVVSDSDGRLRSESYQLTVLPKDLPEAPMVPLPEPDLPVVDDERDDSAIEPIQEIVISIIADQIDNNSNLDPDLSKKSDSIPNQEPVVTVDTASSAPVAIAITDSVRDDSGQSTVENDRNQEPMPVQIAVEALLDSFESLETNTSVMPRLIAPSIDAFPQGIVIPFEWNQEPGLDNDSQTASDDKMSTDQETDAETDDLTTDSVLTEKGATAGASKGFSKEQSVLVHLVTFGIVALYSILSYSFLKKKR